MRSPVHRMIWYAQLRSSPHVQVKLPPVKNAVSARGPRALGWQWGEMLGLIWIAWHCHPRIWWHFRNCTPHSFLSCQLAIMGTSLYNYSHFLNESPEHMWISRGHAWWPDMQHAGAPDAQEVLTAMEGLNKTHTAGSPGRMKLHEITVSVHFQDHSMLPCWGAWSSH